jgi:hypothetical protein
VEGRAWVERIATVPKREKRKQRRVTFKDEIEDVDEENIE